jgi:hypothetical protein
MYRCVECNVHPLLVNKQGMHFIYDTGQCRIRIFPSASKQHNVGCFLLSGLPLTRNVNQVDHDRYKHQSLDEISMCRELKALYGIIDNATGKNWINVEYTQARMNMAVRRSGNVLRKSLRP